MLYKVTLFFHFLYAYIIRLPGCVPYICCLSIYTKAATTTTTVTLNERFKSELFYTSPVNVYRHTHPPTSTHSTQSQTTTIYVQLDYLLFVKIQFNWFNVSCQHRYKRFGYQMYIISFELK